MFWTDLIKENYLLKEWKTISANFWTLFDNFFYRLANFLIWPKHIKNNKWTKPDKKRQNHTSANFLVIVFYKVFCGITHTQIVLEEVHPSLICVLGYPFILNINVHLVDNDRSDVFVFACLFFWMQDPDLVEVTSYQGVLCPHSR